MNPASRANLLYTLELLAALALGLLLLIALGVVAHALAPVLVLFALALVLAFVLEPVVSMAHRRLRVPRSVGVLLTYVLVVGVLLALGGLVVPPLLDQAGQLLGLSVRVARSLTDPASPWYAAAERAGLAAGMTQAVAALIAQLQSMADDIARVAFTLVRSIGVGLVELFLLFVISFYMLTSGARLATLVPGLSPQQQDVVSAVEPEVAETLARYLRARLFLSVCVGVLFGAAAYAIGLPYPVILGTTAGVLELIPFLGPVLGALPALTVAGVEGPLWRVIAILIAFVVIQQLEGNILAPKITADAVRLHPLVVLFAVLAASQLAGVWGALLVTPLLGCCVAAGRVAQKYFRPRLIAGAVPELEQLPRDTVQPRPPQAA